MFSFLSFIQKILVSFSQVSEERLPDRRGVLALGRALEQRQQCPEGRGQTRQDGLRQERHSE